MQSMSLLVRGSMVSLSALALPALVLIAALAPAGAAAQPPRPGGDGWSMNMPRAGAWPPPGARQQNAPGPAAVPRGDLRGDIADNARQRATPGRQEPPQTQRR